MKFIIQLGKNGVTIQPAALKVSGFDFDTDEQAELHTLQNTVVVLKSKMTAMELVRAINTLHHLAVELSINLAKVCGPCNGCEEDCPVGNIDGAPSLSDNSWGELQLNAYEDREKNLVPATRTKHGYGLCDMPPYVLDMMVSVGICLRELEQHLMMEDTVYGK